MMEFVLYLQNVQKQPGYSRNLLRKLLHKPKQESSQSIANRHSEKWLSGPNIGYQTYQVKSGLPVPPRLLTSALL